MQLTVTLAGDVATFILAEYLSLDCKPVRVLAVPAVSVPLEYVYGVTSPAKSMRFVELAPTVPRETACRLVKVALLSEDKMSAVIATLDEDVLLIKHIVL